MIFSKFYFILFLFNISCTQYSKNCIVDFHFDRPDYPSPDVIELVIQVADEKLFKDIVNGEFRSIHIDKLTDQNLKYHFPIPKEDVLSNFQFRLYIETSYFHKKLINSYELDKRLEELLNTLEVVIFFKNEKVIIGSCESLLGVSGS
ncbi:hypothetical protein [Algoriphagus litoralis]|uniref:hypothetical protein n=1 Tax=Algoriphagus litoralis TaxID=2202829 RepID=UPI000DB91B15|nr:hypothetical protein [Algoriphagus litoralis]